MRIIDMTALSEQERVRFSSVQPGTWWSEHVQVLTADGEDDHELLLDDEAMDRFRVYASLFYFKLQDGALSLLTGANYTAIRDRWFAAQPPKLKPGQVLWINRRGRVTTRYWRTLLVERAVPCTEQAWADHLGRRKAEEIAAVEARYGSVLSIKS